MAIMMIMMVGTMMEVMMMMGPIVMMATRRRRMNAKQTHAHSSSIIWFNFDNRDLKCFVWHLHWAQSRNLAFSKDSLCFHLYQWDESGAYSFFNITIIAHFRSHHYHSDDNWHGDYRQTHDGVHQQNHKGEHYQTHDGDCNQTDDGKHRQNHDGKHFQETCCQRRRSWCWSTLPIRWSYLLP